MKDVLDALRINQMRLAEDLFARVSKRAVLAGIERHKSNALVSYPKVQMVRSEDLSPYAISFILLIEQRVICTLDAVENVADVGGGTHPIKADAKLGAVAWRIGDQIGMAFTGAPQAFLVDALTTSIDQQDRGLWTFRWKQKYAV